jgi:hypothetical protein
MSSPFARRPPPIGTKRLIGAVLTAGGRALDIALLETDAVTRIRRIETERVNLDAFPLDNGPVDARPVDAAVIAALLTFMGDRSLQPSALDLIVIEAGVPGLQANAVAAGTDVETIASKADGRWASFAKAEQLALAGVGI